MTKPTAKSLTLHIADTQLLGEHTVQCVLETLFDKLNVGSPGIHETLQYLCRERCKKIISRANDREQQMMIDSGMG